jgi:hypothetical protein
VNGRPRASNAVTRTIKRTNHDSVARSRPRQS